MKNIILTKNILRILRPKMFADPGWWVELVKKILYR